MQGNDSFRLVVRRGPQPNQTYDLNKDIVTLGRDITNDITINDPEVSRHHMRLTRGAGGFTVEDLGSTNGTFVNGQRLTGARPLRNGDMIGLGETVTLAYEATVAGGAQSGYEEPPMAASTAPNTPAPSAAPPQQQPYAPPPAGGQPQQPAQAPYTPPGYEQQPQQPAPGQPAYGQDYGQYAPEHDAPAPGQDFSPASPPYAGAPAAPPQGEYGGYDPYEVREERNTTRWILIGCAGVAVFCCCGTLVGAFAVDQFCLWDRIPVIYDVISSLGYQMVCGP
jgi:hypothetical protein